jgi:FMN phosphatase YigB (HAD superfamily)
VSSERLCDGTIGFDLDGVIMQNPFGKGVFPRIRAYIREHAESLPTSDVSEADRMIDKKIREGWRRRMEAGRYVDAYDWDDIFTEVSRSFGGPDVPDVSATVRECCELDDMIALLPGVREGLDLLRSRGFRLVAITNGFRPYQEPVLEALEVATYFDAVYTPDVTGFAKPDPKAFDVVPGLVAHVGDTLMHDVLGANLAGKLAVLMDPDMPSSLRSLEPRERIHTSQAKAYLSQKFEDSLYREFHPEATLERCMPFALVTSVDEAARSLVTHLCGALKPD